VVGKKKEKKRSLAYTSMHIAHFTVSLCNSEILLYVVFYREPVKW
jgi:hypothetical protein